MKIKNSKDLIINREREGTLQIIEAGLEAIDTGRVIKGIKLEGDNLIVKGENISLGKAKRIFVVGVGKCASDAAIILEDILGDRLAGGVVIDVKENPGLTRIEYYRGTHPFPSLENGKATKALLESLKGLGENDFVIFIISGGGSTLLHSSENIKPEDEAEMLRLLFKKGATIQEINSVRKHLSPARGGYLAKHAFPAKGLALIFSDVPGDDVQFIASGPTVKDVTTIKDAEKILAKYEVFQKRGIEGRGLIETPKDDKYFEGIKNIVLVSNKDALRAMAEKAKKLGFSADVRSTELVGEARDVAESVMNDLHKMPDGTVLLYGGETTVTVGENGKGGRNLELVLSASRFIKRGELIAAVASDGRDNTNFAGAFCDKITVEKIKKLGLDPEKYLEENTSYEFFDKVGDYFLTGDTGSNVSDLIIAIKSLPA